MKRIAYILSIITLFVASSCLDEQTQSSSTEAFSLTCTVDASLKRDSATLYIVEESYNKLVNCGLRTNKAGAPLQWDGNIDGAKAAFIKFTNDTIPFYLIIEPGTCHVTITRTSWAIAGGRCNAEYSRYITHRQAIVKARKQVFLDYMKQVKDSTLTQEIEQKYVIQDSMLRDSLHRYTAWRMTTGGPVSLIAREKFYNTLPRLFQKAVDR